MKFLNVFIIFFLFASLSFGEDGSEEKGPSYLNRENTEKMMLKVGDLASVEVNEFPEKFRTVESEVLDFLQFKKKQCKGEFSTLKLDEYGEEKLVKMKLSKKEREMCYREVKSFMRHYLDKAYEAKEKFLKSLLNIELKSLEEAKKNQLEKIESLI